MTRETAAADAVASSPPSPPFRLLMASESSTTASSVLASEIGEIDEARENGSDETLAENGTFASPAIAFALEASGTADLARDPPETAAPAPVDLAVEQTVEPGRIATEPSDAERAVAEAATEPPDPAPASMAAPVPTTEPVGDAAERGAVRPRRSPGPGPATMPDPPQWLPRALWDRWQSHRRALKKPVTADGALLTLAQLEKAKGFGHDPVELLETAIANGWQGCVFPDKHYRPAAVRPTSGPSRAGARRSLRDVPTDPAVYLETAGFETELEAA